MFAPLVIGEARSSIRFLNIAFVPARAICRMPAPAIVIPVLTKSFPIVFTLECDQPLLESRRLIAIRARLALLDLLLLIRRRFLGRLSLPRIPRKLRATSFTRLVSMLPL